MCCEFEHGVKRNAVRQYHEEDSYFLRWVTRFAEGRVTIVIFRAL